MNIQTLVSIFVHAKKSKATKEGEQVVEGSRGFCTGEYRGNFSSWHKERITGVVISDDRGHFFTTSNEHVRRNYYGGAGIQAQHII
jgi:hypothetical protein